MAQKAFCSVMDGRTGQVQVFGLSPEEAVKVAYLQDNGDFNTWDYAKRKVTLTYGKESVACGDFIAFRKGSKYATSTL